MPLSRYAGTYDPAELQLIQRVFDLLCAQRGLTVREKERREDLAADILRVFNDGTRTEADLLRTLSRQADRS
ncbi:RNA-binding protein [Mesorhizobium sp. WSM4976]|uniref:RNA-binding protein n=1 Tax=Mesorhizobium sp. WSM4976 TaxID=3038549 RepID=UPI0024164AB5|nr:RNA-binding protein [Mesorhizobium sp. WSM4976]MDG4897749.1 RNA-binding protein [Mesorhizobium sp. WSM4976]